MPLPMKPAPAQQSFHWLLTAGLLGSLLLYVLAALVGAISRSAGPSLMVAALGVVTQLVTIPTAIYLLARGGYRTIGNFAVTLVALVPLLFVLLVAFTFFFGHWHM